MAYVVQSSEKLRAAGAEYETRAMLYLMNCREDSYEIYYYIMDFFNDVTGLDAHAEKAWDVQSKGAKNNSPRAIGQELVTLFKNYLSELRFDYLILFLGGVTGSFRIDSTKKTFGIDNVKEQALKKLKEGLIEEAKRKTYIEDEDITDDNIDDFLGKVTFVVDERSKADYIRDLINVNPKYIPKDEVLDGIFNTIRDAQASKKNNESVEGEVISALRECLFYDRALKAKEIRLMVLNVFINGDIMKRGVPVHFYPIIKRYDAIKQQDLVEDCKLKISTLLFDKANTDNFWKLLETVSDAVVDNVDKGTIEIHELIKDNPVIKNPKLDLMSVYYLISVMKEALQ